MAYRFTLPAQPSPYTNRPRELSLRSQTLSNTPTSGPCFKRSSLYTHDMHYVTERTIKKHARVEDIGKENIKITTYPASQKKSADDDGCHYDPSDPNTWGVKPLPPLPDDFSSALSRDSSTLCETDDDAAMIQSPILKAYSDAPETCHNLAQLIDNHLRIDSEGTRSSSNHRTTSSSYHDPDSEPSRVQSPFSNAHGNTLNVSDLAKYGKANDRLSNLRSGSPSLATDEFLLHTGGDPHDTSLEAND